MLRKPARRGQILLAEASGASGGLFIATSDLTQFLVKFPSRCGASGSPHAPANEVIAAELSTLLDVPSLPWEFVTWQGETGWGSLRMPNAEFSPVTDEVAHALLEPGLFAAIAVFDLLICNTDRHSRNLLGRRSPKGGYQLLANDHSHSLLREGLQPANMANAYERVISEEPQRFFRCADLRSGVTLCDMLLGTLARVETIGQRQIEYAVDAAPDEWLAPDDKKAVAAFLLERARNIRPLMQRVQPLFPNLAGVQL